MERIHVMVWKAAWKTVWATAVALCVIAWCMTCALVVGGVAHASTGKVLYSAQFDWKAPSGASKKMRLQMISLETGKLRVSIARKTGASRYKNEAVCQVTSAEKELAAFNLACESAGFGPLATPATLFVTLPRNRIQFGTWVGGYQQASLHVDFDRLPNRKPAKAKELKLAKRG